MHYQANIPVQSNENAVLNETARQLISCGFQLASQNENEVTLTHKGMRSTKQNPVLGATKITLRQSHVSRGKISVSADLGGVRWMRSFVMLFPPLLMAGILTINLALAAIFQNIPQGLFFKLIAGLVFVAFLSSFAGMILVKRIRKNTEQAIEACVTNADGLVQRAQR